MKISRYESAFAPVVITLETLEELQEYYNIMGEMDYSLTVGVYEELGLILMENLD